MYATKKIEMVDQIERFLSKTFRAQPVLAQILSNFVGFFRVPEGKLLPQGELHPLRYDYRDQ